MIFRRYAHIILPIISTVGVVTTSILSSKASVKASKILEEYKDEDLKIFDKTRLIWKEYIFAGFAGLVTIASIIGASKFNRNRELSLASAYVLADRIYKDNKEAIDELIDPKDRDKIEKRIIEKKLKLSDVRYDPNSNKMIFYEKHFPDFFECTMLEVILAAFELNKIFAQKGYANLNMFYEELNLPAIRAGDELGWTYLDGQDVEYSWIDISFQKIQVDDLSCIIIEFESEPKLNYV